MILFIKAIASHDWDALQVKAVYLLIIYTLVFLAMGVDLIAGLYKAGQRKELRTSIGIRRTVDKAWKYFGTLLLFTFADVVASLVVDLPYFTAVWALFLIGIEIKSMFEKYDQKDRDKIILTGKQFAAIIKDRDLSSLPEQLVNLVDNKDENEHN